MQSQPSTTTTTVSTAVQTPSLFKELANICSTPSGETQDIITVVLDEKNTLGKQFFLTADGRIEKKSAVSIARAVACQFHVPDLATLEKVLRIVSENQSAAIINAGFKPTAIGEMFVFLSKKALNQLNLKDEDVTSDKGMKAFARLKCHATASSWQLLDRDEDQFTPGWAKKQSFEEWRNSLGKIFPGISQVKMLRAHSASARVLKADGTPAGGGNGHVWIKIADANDAERARTAISARALENNLAWPKPRFSKTTGEECGRGLATIIDASVWTIGRLIFVGRPTCHGGLRLIPQAFETIPGIMDVLDTSAAVVDVLETVKASSKLGIKTKLKEKSEPSSTKVTYRSEIANLKHETEIELEDGTITTVAKLMANYQDKVRCQAPFRASTSVAAFFALDKKGNPYVYDTGTDTKHVLAKPERRQDKDFDALLNRLKNNLGNLIGRDNADFVIHDANFRTAWDSCFFNPKNSKVTMLNRNDELIHLSDKDAQSFGLGRVFSEIYDRELTAAAIDKLNLDTQKKHDLREEMAKLPWGDFLRTLKLCRQANSLEVSVDIFASKASITIRDGIAAVVLPHRSFEVPTGIEQSLIEEVVTDYEAHFPEFIDFVNLVLYSRFATDRRQAFVWLHTSSSWGKGFLVSLFASLGLVVDVSTKEIDKALTGSPVGLSLNSMLRTWILFVDEFKSATSELKLLNMQITLSPKNELRCTVPLYTKLFASAENVRSLVGDGVESQFNNRFAYLSPETTGQKIEDRPLFERIGKMQYGAALKAFLAVHLNAYVDHMRKDGPVKASKIADNYLAEFQQNRRMQDSFGSLDETIDDIVKAIGECLRSFGTWSWHRDTEVRPPAIVEGIGQRLIQTLQRTSQVGYVSDGTNGRQRRLAIVLSDAEKFVKSYLALSGDASTIGKLQYKSKVIVDGLNMHPNPEGGRYRVYDAKEGGNEIDKKRGIVIFL